MTTKEAAARLGCTQEWMRRLCKEGRIPCTFEGRDWHIKEEDLPASLAAVPKKPMGRPPKEQTK